jgi:hypothetical protein
LIQAGCLCTISACITKDIHIDALRSEARLFGVDVLHAPTPDAAAAVLLGEEARQPVPLADDLGLDSSPIL